MSTSVMELPTTDSGCVSSCSYNTKDSGSDCPSIRSRQSDDSPLASDQPGPPVVGGDGGCLSPVRLKIFELSTSESDSLGGSQESISDSALRRSSGATQESGSSENAEFALPLCEQKVIKSSGLLCCNSNDVFITARKTSNIYPLSSAYSTTKQAYFSSPDLAHVPESPQLFCKHSSTHAVQKKSAAAASNPVWPVSRTPEQKPKNARNGAGIFSQLPFVRRVCKHTARSSSLRSDSPGTELQNTVVVNNVNTAATYSASEYNRDSRPKPVLIQNATAASSESGSTGNKRQNLTNQLSSSLEDPGPHRFQDAPSTSKSASCPLLKNVPGMKYKMLKEGQVQLCKFQHPRTVFGKIAAHSKLLRRWEPHTLVLDKEEIWSKNAVGFMENAIPYAAIEDVHIIANSDSADRFFIQLSVSNGSILIQSNNSYLRNQWLHSILWRRSILRQRKLFEKLERPEIVLKELKNLVGLVREVSLQDDLVYSEPLELCSIVLSQIETGKLPRNLLESVISLISPLLENFPLIPDICDTFGKFCRDNPRSSVVDGTFTTVAHQILKKNMDFGKNPSLRTFVQDVIIALNCKNDGLSKVKEFIESTHGPVSCCPHPRVLPNLMSVCLASVSSLFEDQNFLLSPEDYDQRLECFASIFDILANYEDWRPNVASILQPIPFHDSVLSNPVFIKHLTQIVERIGTDSRCEVHLCVLGVREGKEGWFHLVCPAGICSSDEGEVFSKVLKSLLRCCCKRKRFFMSIKSMIGPLELLALRECEIAMEALCSMIEFEVVEGEDTKLQMISALQSTQPGKKQYAQLCDRQIALKELQQKGGPRKLTLPSKSTDTDLAVLLSSGSFGNLEWLSLAFTSVTSACAEYLVKLPSLKYLNLWSTQFGDVGVQLLSEHLQKLQVLNLCETPVTDKGLLTLTSLKSLRKLNLNSTQLSARTFQILRSKLPVLQEADIRYTDAWCADDVIPTQAV